MAVRLIYLLAFWGLCNFSEERVLLSSQPLAAVENTSYVLICTARTESWNADWYMNGSLTHSVTRIQNGNKDCNYTSVVHVNGTVTPMTGFYVSKGTSYSIIFPSVPAVLNNSIWTCSLDNRRSLPYEVIITERPQTKINVIPNDGLNRDEVTLTEGEEVNITCSTTPHMSTSATHRLTIAGSGLTKSLILQENSNLVARATWNVGRGYTYISCFVQENNQALSNGILRMNILHTPTVLVSIKYGSQLTLRGELTLLCNITANPNVTKVFWRHFMNGRLLREFSRNNSQSSLSLNDITYEDDGDYYCNVTNDISEDYVFNSTKVRIMGPPVILRSYQNTFNPDETDQVIFKITYMESTTVRNETWLFEGSKLDFEAVRESKKVDFQMIMHNVTVTREGHEATLTLYNVSLKHNGNYSFVICTEFSCSTSVPMSLTVSGQDKPSTPNIIIPVCVAVGILVFIGLIVLVSVYYRKRSRQTDKAPRATVRDVDEMEISHYTQLQDRPEQAPAPVYDKLTVYQNI